MNEKIKGVLIAIAAVAALGVGGAAIAGAAGSESTPSEQPTQELTASPAEDESGPEDSQESEAPINGSTLDQASAAALDHTGGGQVSETEVGDEESYYEVEVSLDDGSQVDVQLDRDFNVVGQESDEQE
ncbi:MAG: PepSY domain-containing protein [Solirubrobacterales bacterium]